MRNRWRFGLAAMVLFASLLAVNTLAYGQGAANTSPLSGTVTDTSGGVVPGANVVVKNNATAASFESVTDSNGQFTIPTLNPGSYTVTVSLTGFKTWSSPDVLIQAATPTHVNVKLEVGKLEETVVVQGAAEIVQTQTASVQTTLQVQQIQQLPLVTRTALDFVTALPGVQTAGAGSRNSIINGLPSVTINITLDGVNVQDNNNRNGDGFFMYIRPMLDSVEEITVSTSTPGAESAGQGGSAIRMVTRSGTNKFSGSAYNTWRNQAGKSFIWGLNTPYWFNKRDLPKLPNGDYFIDSVKLQTPGFRVGGPIVFPKLFDGHDKAFFFFNWEWFLWPNQMGRTRYLLTKPAMNGNFTYVGNDGQRHTINLLTDIAAKNGQVSTINPTVARLLGDIRSAAESAGGGIDESYDLNEAKLTYSPGGDNKRHFPTGRVDINVTPRHRLTFTTRYNRFDAGPDFLNGAEPRFPGFANWGGQYSNRYMTSATVRSTFGSNVVNEARWGFSGGTTQWYPEFVKSQFDCTGVGCQGPYSLNMVAVGNANLTGATTGTAPSSRYVPDFVYEDTLSWIKGRHSVSLGASLTQIKFENWDNPAGVVPAITFGVNSLDPAYQYFAYNSGNFPGGISDTYAGYARNLYALLTGRVTGVAGQAVLGTDGQYKYLGDRWQKGGMNEIGLFFSDSWKVRPNLTLNAGVRWELQLPFRPDNSVWARPEQWTDVYGISGEGNLFKPGTMTGRKPVLVQYGAGFSAYNTDWNNVAPSIGIAWRPSLKAGLLTKIFSQDPVIRGGYSITYTRYGTGDFSGIYGANPGSRRDASRTIALGNLGNDGLGLPVLLSQAARLGPADFALTPAYPFSASSSENIAVMDPNLHVPYTQQYSIGWQRELGKKAAIEVRYVGNRFTGGWTTVNLNGNANWSVIENGFMDEFRKAQANLQANIAAGKGNTFAYTGAAGTSPLPIFMAYLQGVPLNDARNQSAANYTSSNFKSSSWYNNLKLYDPNPLGMAGTGTNGLQNAAFKANAAAAGLPANFFMVNPDNFQGNSNLMYNGGTTRYDGLQFDFRRRMSDGVLVAGSYVFSKSLGWSRPTLRNDFVTQLSGNNVDHAIKLNWVWELPFGQGRRWGSGVSRTMNHLIGGWEIDGAARIQSGQIVNFGNVRLVGMTDKDLAEMFKLYKLKDANGTERIYMLPQDVIANSIIALSSASATSPTGFSGPAPTGRYIARASSPDCVQAYAGQCAPLNHFVRGPWFGRGDLSVAKRFELAAGKRLEVRMDLYNVLDNINFTPVAGLGNSLSGWEVTSAARDANASQDPGGRITSFALRFSW